MKINMRKFFIIYALAISIPLSAMQPTDQSTDNSTTSEAFNLDSLGHLKEDVKNQIIILSYQAMWEYAQEKYPSLAQKKVKNINDVLDAIDIEFNIPLALNDNLSIEDQKLVIQWHREECDKKYNDVVRVKTNKQKELVERVKNKKSLPKPYLKYQTETQNTQSNSSDNISSITPTKIFLATLGIACCAGGGFIIWKKNSKQETPKESSTHA